LGIVLLLITGTLVTFLITHSSKQTILTANKPTLSTQQTHISNIQKSSPDKQTSLSEPKNNLVDLIVANNVPSLTRFDAPVVNDWIPAPGYDSPAKKEVEFEPLNTDITDELTDQDIFSNFQSQKRVDYPRSLRASNSFDWTIESVLNSFIESRRNKRLSLQFSFTPTVSYRKLTSNKSFIASAAATNAPSSYAPLYDINSVVTHKPDLGLEFGLATKYSLASNFKVKAGLQFNINRYDIKAFNSSFEVAKIALRGNGGVDSFYAVSTHRNFNGYKSDWLHNFYFEISMPVGVEVNIVGDDKVQFGVAGTIQPTYVLGDRAYLLSTDYKNYAEVPWLIRRWNVNTGLETFVSYSTGKMKWQVGPQVRYQLLSSFIDKYPVKENLFDFGLKVGVSLNK
jgi:hypothetical protein